MPTKTRENCFSEPGGQRHQNGVHSIVDEMKETRNQQEDVSTETDQTSCWFECA